MSKAQFVTPKGEIMWATINGAGKADLQGRMKYSIDIVCDPDDAAPAIAQLEELWEEHKPKGTKNAKSMGYKHEDDGRVRFMLKTDVTYPSGDAKAIKTYDAKAKQFELEDKIGNGSIGRASGLASVYDGGNAATRGVTLYLDSVQIVKLIKYQGAAASFEEEDGGFMADEDNQFEAEDLV